MTDTIELLEVIGRDASLRHASTEELTKVLEEVQASEALTAAVITGDSMQLVRELGNKPLLPPQVTQAPGREEEPDQEDEDDESSPSPVPKREKFSPR